MSGSRLWNALTTVACALLAAVVLAVPAGAATVHFQKESQTAYEGQLRHGQVHAVAFHPAAGTGHLHISLNNGAHMTVAYAAAEQSKLVAQAHAAHASVRIATVKAKTTTAVKHKLRYIAGGILIAVILIVLVVLLIGRRRTLAQEGPDASGESGA